MTLSQSSVLKLYHSVIEDVIAGVRDSFLDDGVDEQVLQELKQTWEAKLVTNKAVEQNPEPPSDAQVTPNLYRVNTKQTTNRKNFTAPLESVEGRLNDAGFSHEPPAINITSQQQEKLYPVQITLPAQQGSGETSSRVLTIQVPESGITGNQLQTVLTGPLIAATLALPTSLATTLLQQHVTAALRGHQTANILTTRTFNQGNGSGPGRVDGADDPADFEPQPSTSKQRKLKKLSKPLSSVQTDGGIDTSDDDDDEDDDDDGEDDDDDDEDKDEDGEEAEGGAEEEPLNSEDDVSDEDVSDLFDTDNVVVCQYDKITRSRNKWKFYLKDGIMNLSGKDYVFQKSNGDAEW